MTPVQAPAATARPNLTSPPRITGLSFVSAQSAPVSMSAVLAASSLAPLRTVASLASLPLLVTDLIIGSLAQDFEKDPRGTSRALACLAKSCRAVREPALHCLVRLTATLRLGPVDESTGTATARALLEFSYGSGMAPLGWFTVDPAPKPLLSKGGATCAEIDVPSAPFPAAERALAPAPALALAPATNKGIVTVPASWVRTLRVCDIKSNNTYPPFPTDAPQWTAHAILTALTHADHLQFLWYATSACLRHVLRHPTSGTRVKTISMNAVSSELRSLAGMWLPNVTSFDYASFRRPRMLPKMPRLETLAIWARLHPMRRGMARAFVRHLETVTDLTLIDQNDNGGDPDGFMRSFNVVFPPGAGQRVRHAKLTPSAVMWLIPDRRDISADATTDGATAAATSALDQSRYEPSPPLSLTHLELLGSGTVPIASLRCDFACLTNLVSLTVKRKYCKQEENKHHGAHLTVKQLQQLALLPHLAFLDAPIATPESKPGATWVQQVSAVAAALRGQPVFPALERVVTTFIFCTAIQPAHLPRLTHMNVSVPERSWFVSKLYMPSAPLLTDLVVVASNFREITEDFPGPLIVQEKQPVDANPVLCERVPQLQSYVWHMPEILREAMYNYPFKIL
ncbi:hypothetical protein AMAG_13368 [Allomyces macrogynus ATCC 38327]|uniref:Uncharacterized protein n=1 Tax=Allomyces macrogynus (strain ATCC 38327) TaxID=578462 RepID=A0A0L0T1X0_ALLM3|nr:hypothetical protein AMAG_13368 [Allomyces macrogynus ATCC 38327]|eukprot:KNE68727.1 hypothetical protein AMAG_13368 [Allomyces macrogynus ATCC 38327]